MAQPVAEATANSPRYNERLSRARSHNSPNSPMSVAQPIAQPIAQPVAQPVAQPAADPFAASGFGGGDPFGMEAAPVRSEMRITFPSGAPLGVGLTQKDGKVTVDLVQPTSAAAAVPVGATIQDVNGASCEGKGMKEVMAMIVDAKSAGEVTATFLVELAGVLEA